MKLSQVLNAYGCDIALMEMTEKTALKYLREHDIVDTDVERISQQLLKKQIRENKIKALCVEFHRLGMIKVMGEYDPEYPKVEDIHSLLDNFKNQIEELL